MSSRPYSCYICKFETPHLKIFSRHQWSKHRIPPAHGTNARYSHRSEPCHCDECTAAHNAATAASARARRALRPAVPKQRRGHLKPVKNLDWYDRGACLGSGLDFFTEAPSQEVLDLCASCDVRKECLSWAVAQDEYYVWGGTTKPQRDAMMA